jgi:HlyD family secretion protein
MEQQHFFRKKSLERLRSPERLDQPVRIVTPLDWLPLSVLGLLLLLGLLWSLVGKLPTGIDQEGWVRSSPDQNNGTIRTNPTLLK